jgi:hypothetical protein
MSSGQGDGSNPQHSERLPAAALVRLAILLKCNFEFYFYLQRWRSLCSILRKLLCNLTDGAWNGISLSPKHR